MLDKQKHEITMRKILGEIYDSPILAPNLAFKGGTCLYFFHGLDRFSTDLDFNLLQADFQPEILTKILEKYLQISETSQKHFTWFWRGSYQKDNPQIKVEISKRDYPDKYEFLDFYGLKIRAMTKDCMFAHKLCAITDRKVLQNRDLYDSWFMFERGFEINEAIIQTRTGKNPKDYFAYLIEFISKEIKNKNSILEGLGEVLDEKQKIWVKEKLLDQLLFELKIRS